MKFIVPCFFLISLKVFSFEVYDPEQKMYFSVKSCTPVTGQVVNEVKYILCDGDIEKIAQNVICTNFNDGCLELNKNQVLQPSYPQANKIYEASSTTIQFHSSEDK